MQAIEPLQYGHTYHIYNRGINGADLFTHEANYKRFLALYERYIRPIADTYAWVLLRNHFHLLVRIKEEAEIPYMKRNLSEQKEATSLEKKLVPLSQFSHIFNSYAQYFNKLNGRHGGLFETSFRRIRVETGKYFRQMVFYIHHNPVKHGFVKHISDWGWSSYLTIISEKPTHLSRETVLEYFDDVANFKAWHQQEHDLKDVGNLLLEV